MPAAAAAAQALCSLLLHPVRKQQNSTLVIQLESRSKFCSESRGRRRLAAALQLNSIEFAGLEMLRGW
jgi:hypothetical protein